ncbi:hypothetical protein QFZ96_007596 [Paraburkholderia youngii]
MASEVFWNSVPAVIAPTATIDISTTSHAGALPCVGGVAAASFGASTSTTPARPTAMPLQPRRDKRSPNSGAATAAVASGCSAPSKAITPALRPCATAQ